MARRIEWLTALGLLLSHAGFFFRLLYPDVIQNSTELVSTDLHPAALAITLLLYISVFSFILRRYKQTFRSIRSSYLYMAIPLLAVVSTVWSYEPDLTIRRSFLFVLSCVIALYIGERFTIRQIGTLYVSMLIIETLPPVILYPIAPQFVIDPFFGNAWRALTDQKNVFGGLMCQAILAYFLIGPRRYPIIRYSLVITAAILLFLSKSSSAALVGCLILLVLPLLYIMRFTKKQLVATVPSLVLLIGTGAVLLIRFQDLAFGALGRDSTLTGRTGIWQLILVSIARRPFLGYGYNAYWVGMKGESLNVILASGWLVPNAHNGYFDLTLELGLVGLTLFIIVFSKTIRVAFIYLRSSGGAYTMWPMVFLIFMLLHSFGESDLANHNVLTFFLFLAISRALAKWHANMGTKSKDLAGRPMGALSLN